MNIRPTVLLAGLLGTALVTQVCGQFDPKILDWPAQKHCDVLFPTVPKCRGSKAPAFYKHSKIAIIGAGPSGVNMAYVLKNLGYTNVKIFEKTERIGGLAKTNKYNGVTHEMGACYTAGNYT